VGSVTFPEQTYSGGPEHRAEHLASDTFARPFSDVWQRRSSSATENVPRIQRQPASAKRAVAVVEFLSNCQCIGRDGRHHSFCFTRVQECFTESQQQIATLRFVVRIHQILHEEHALEQPLSLGRYSREVARPGDAILRGL
jgi:hypothetical protein